MSKKLRITLDSCTGLCCQCNGSHVDYDIPEDWETFTDQEQEEFARECFFDIVSYGFEIIEEQS